MQADPSPAPPSRRLEGWQEIADHFDVTVRQAQTWRKQQGLPVHGGRPHRLRVWALTDELDEWRDRHRAQPASQTGTTAPTEDLNHQADAHVLAAKASNAGLRHAFFAFLLLLAGGIVGFLTHKSLVSNEQEARFRSTSGKPSPWHLQLIHGIDGGTETIWRETWKDIFWVTPDEAWLCGEVESGGARGLVGAGILLHTTDRGVSWKRVDFGKFQDERGAFGGIYDGQTWRGVGPINSLHVTRKNLGGGQWQFEPWFAAETGVYHSDDAGRTWQRSTPPPDSPTYPIPYAHFGNLFSIVASDEMYTVGWQGIAHWSSKGGWELQLQTGSYSINAVYAYPAAPDWDVWAVGSPADKKAPRYIYHLKRPSFWEGLVADGVEIDPSHGGLQGMPGRS
jgi:hypothetical protein